MIDQRTADQFIRLAKMKLDDTVHDLAAPKLSIPLIGQSSPQEEFILDIHKNSICVERHVIQNRVRKSIGLVRVDISERGQHTNPDGILIRGPHIHFYREGYELKWAFELPYSGDYGHFTDHGNLLRNLEQIYTICNVGEPPNFQGGLL